MQQQVATTATFEPMQIAAEGVPMHIGFRNRYAVECFDADGDLRWVDYIDNLVPNVGLDELLDKFLKGAAYTAQFFVGLTGATPTIAAGNNMASHAGWTDDTTYSNATRPALTLGAVSGQSVSNSASVAVFNINGAGTIGGAFVTTNNTKGGTTGILFGVGAFAGGNRTVANLDTLNVTVTITATG